LFFEGLQHPTALALAELGEGRELTVMVPEEGDLSPRMYAVRELIPESTLPVKPPSDPIDPRTLLAMAELPDTVQPRLRDATGVATASAVLTDDGSDSGSSGTKWPLLKQVVQSLLSAAGQQLIASALGPLKAVAGVNVDREELLGAIAEAFEGAASDWLDALTALLARLDWRRPDVAAEAARVVDQAVASDPLEPVEEPLADTASPTQAVPESTAVDRAIAEAEPVEVWRASGNQPADPDAPALLGREKPTKTQRTGRPAPLETGELGGESGRPGRPSSDGSKDNRLAAATTEPADARALLPWMLGGSFTAAAAAVVGGGIYLATRRRRGKGSDRHAGTNEGLSAV
jgi:hypothetical protein